MKQEDIARITKLTRATVSRAINNDPRVSEETRLRVFKAMEETGYSPHAAARSLASAKAHSIGICFYDSEYVSSPFFAGITQGILEISSSKGYSLVLTTTQGGDSKTDLNIMNYISAKRIDGAIICDDVIGMDKIEKIHKKNFPIVMLNRTARINNQIPSINDDHQRGIELAMRHLIELGHKRIGIIVPPVDSSYREERLLAYKYTLDRAGIEYNNNLVLALTDLPENIEFSSISTEFINRFLSIATPATAMIFPEGDSAYEAIRILNERGLNVPKDISVIGINGVNEPGFTQPILTTIQIHNKEIGRQATRMLLNLIKGKVNEPKRIMISPELIVRKTTGPAPG